ncbi:hypothetical protein [Luteimonas sp. R10]|uniref:hypothetical protein n=1 Tax=Luteimonas sp. R10 TaxID=3108176 RepID=UPI003093910F|nr:hypothetical protein U3649_17405 [Luteimonas sp. R10]
MLDLFGTRRAAAAAVALLVDVTRADLAELRRCLRLDERAAAADRLHRMLGGLAALGRSPLIDDGRALLAALRANDGDAGYAAVLGFAAKLDALLERLGASPAGEAVAATDVIEERRCKAAPPRRRRPAAPDHATA